MVFVELLRVREDGEFEIVCRGYGRTLESRSVVWPSESTYNLETVIGGI